MYSDGYKYWFAFKTDKTSYYRCCRYITSKCPGKCSVDGIKIKTTSQHNHPPEPNRALVDKFRKVLTNRASKETGLSLYSIYCDEATNRHAEASLLYPFQSAESAMRKARRKKLPQSPNNVTDIIDVLDTTDLFRINSGNSKDPLYQKTIIINEKNKEDCICMIFMHRKTFDLFGRIDEIHIDSSFEFIMQNQPSYFLITFHAIQGSVNAPVLYAITTAKSQSSYTAVFMYLRDDLKLQPNTLISNFSRTMQSSLSYVFPQATIKGNWFHYTDAVLSQMENFGLKRETKSNPASALRMLLVLPLLPPEYMRNGLESLRKWMKHNEISTESLKSICDYVENSWLRKFGCEKISIFGTTRIVSNHLKNFNRDLADYIGTQNPVIWVILDSLTQLATKIFLRTCRKFKNIKEPQPKNLPINSLNEAIILPRTQKRNELVSETIITTATQVWIKTPVHLRNPLQFLQLTSHCINESMYLSSLSGTKEYNYLLHKEKLIINTNTGARKSTNFDTDKSNNQHSAPISNSTCSIQTQTQTDDSSLKNFKTTLITTTNFKTICTQTFQTDSDQSDEINSNSEMQTFKSNRDYDVNAVSEVIEIFNSNNEISSHYENNGNNISGELISNGDGLITSNGDLISNWKNTESNNIHNQQNSINQQSNSLENCYQSLQTHGSRNSGIQINLQNSEHSQTNSQYSQVNSNSSQSNPHGNQPQSQNHSHHSSHHHSHHNSHDNSHHISHHNSHHNSHDNSHANSHHNAHISSHNSPSNSIIIQNNLHSSSTNSINPLTNGHNSQTANMLHSQIGGTQQTRLNSNAIHSTTNILDLNGNHGSQLSLLHSVVNSHHDFQQQINFNQQATDSSTNSSVEAHLQELQNAPASPSLSIILPEGTFNCASISTQEFLLAQPGQSLDSQSQQIHSCCYAQNNFLSEQIVTDQNSFLFSFNDDNNVKNNNIIQSSQLNQYQQQQQPHNAKAQKLEKLVPSAAKPVKLNGPPLPPLIFFPSVKRLPIGKKRTLPILENPPPLVPIGSATKKIFGKRFINKN